MNIVKWHKELETGIDIVDMQHKEFFVNANKFIIKVRADKKKVACSEEIDFLINYLLYHFQTEETFQMDSQFPHLLAHQAAHKNIKFQVKEISMKLKIQEYSNESIELFYAMLCNWFEEHILKMDIAFSMYYKQYMEKNQDNT